MSGKLTKRINDSFNSIHIRSFHSSSSRCVFFVCFDVCFCYCLFVCKKYICSLVSYYKCIGVGSKEGSKEMFDLTTHSTHFIYSYMVSGHMAKDHSDN